MAKHKRNTLSEQRIRDILGSDVDAIDHVGGAEWCAWIQGVGYSVWNIADVRALLERIEGING